MLWIFKRITDRLKTVLVANAALDLEAELLIRQTDRRAELLQKACEYEEQGFEELAEELRQGASKLCLEMPFGSIRFEFDSASEEATEEKSGSLEHPPNPRLAFSTTNGTRAKKTKKHVKPRAR